MEISLSNRVALVTGAAQGIGHGIALALARCGADVVICDIETDKGRAAAEAIAALGRRSLFVDANICDPAAIGAMMDRIQETFGRLDIVVNNAAVEYFLPIEQTTLEQWDQTLNVDLKGIFLLTKAALPMLRASDSAVIVNIASVHATATVPDLGAYAAAKGGIVAMTRSLAQDLGKDGIRVVAVSPGFIDAGMTRAWLESQEDPRETRRQVDAMHPAGRIGTPADVGNFVAFVSSESGGFINGVNVIIDGGLTSMLKH